jgi:hypothetical protein
MRTTLPLGPSCTRALVRPASNDHASFEWARRPATTTAEPNAAEDDEKDDVQDETRPLAWCRYAFPATTLACSANESSARDKKNGETLLECFLALLKEGALAFVFAKYSEEQEEEEERVPSRRLDVCLAADAFVDAPAFAEHASRKKKHARLRRVVRVLAVSSGGRRRTLRRGSRSGDGFREPAARRADVCAGV